MTNIKFENLIKILIRFGIRTLKCLIRSIDRDTDIQSIEQNLANKIFNYVLKS
jgi:hypothetical protein